MCYFSLFLMPLTMTKTIPTLLFTLLLAAATAQTEYSEHSIPIRRSHVFEPAKAEPSFNAQLKNIEAPTPSGEGYRSFLMRQKIESQKAFPRKEAPAQKKKKKAAPQPQVGEGFNLTLKLNFFGVKEFSGGIPNDNTLAVSNGGLVLAGVNSVIWGYDLEGDSALFSRSHIMGLQQVGGGNGNNNYFDPKLIYDEAADRFILVFLRNNQPASSAFIVCFSSTNNPVDPWYVYEIPGNPLNNNRWTDFPAINITDDELFITGNLVIPGVTWQVGFDGSVIWQIDKEAAYRNDSILPNKLYSDIRYNGKYTRNLHPVRGVGSTTGSQYFLSNRNFDISNDTIFVMHLEGTLQDSATELSIGMGKTSPNYGVPPNGRQGDTDLSDPTKGLQTNDGRVLGAITNGEWIQFVSNTVNPQTGFSAVYHGLISQPGTPEQKISGSILSDPVLDFGYPNIAFAGNEPCDFESIIGVNFTSPTDFPGVGAFYFGNDSSHSDFIRIKEGDSIVDKHSDSYERWGDYFGIQPRFNQPGKVWIAGFYGLEDTRSGTWVNELSSPDTAAIRATLVESGKPVFCSGRAELVASGGTPPYLYSINGGVAGPANFVDNMCDGDTVHFFVTDSRGCTVSDTVITKKIATGTANGVYPNPFSGQVVSQFQLSRDRQVSAYLFDMKGTLVAKLIDQQGTKGLNELFFNLTPLRQGQYVLRIMADEEELLVEKIIKNE